MSALRTARPATALNSKVPAKVTGPKVVEAKATSPSAIKDLKCECLVKGARCNNPARWPLTHNSQTYFTCTTHHKATTVSLGAKATGPQPTKSKAALMAPAKAKALAPAATPEAPAAS